MSDRLTEIEARAKAATRGPWEDATGSIEPRGIWSSALFVSTATGEVVAGALCPDTGDEGMETPIAGAPPENRAFIAHARDDVPWLVAQVRERDAEIARLRALLTTTGDALATMRSCPFVCACDRCIRDADAALEALDAAAEVPDAR